MTTHLKILSINNQKNRIRPRHKDLWTYSTKNNAYVQSNRQTKLNPKQIQPHIIQNRGCSSNIPIHTKYYANLIPNSFIACASNAAFASVISVSGIRSGPQSIPISCIAFLTGIGFTSQKSFSISGSAFN